MIKIFVSLCVVFSTFANSTHHAGVFSPNVCNLDALYSNGFNYPTPRALLETYFDGKAFDNNSSYTPQERVDLEVDINAIYDRICESAKRRPTPIAVLTAGAPGTGKTTVMRQMLQNEGAGAAYICPDDVCLKSMTLTYLPELASRSKEISNDEKSLRQELYNKWRPGSNAATHAILGNLIKEKYDVFFGTTSSSPFMPNFFQFFKDQEYKIRVLHISAPDAVRWGSIQERDKTFVQTTELDTLVKGDLVPQRIQDTYLKLADEIDFFYRGGVNESAVLAATWVRGVASEKPELTIHNSKCYEEIKKIHDTVCIKINRPEIQWEMAVEENSKMVSITDGIL